MNSKAKALDKFKEKKMEIAHRIAESRKVKSARDLEIERRNNPLNNKIVLAIYKDRHTKRHGGKSKFDNSLKARQDFINDHDNR